MPTTVELAEWAAPGTQAQRRAVIDTLSQLSHGDTSGHLHDECDDPTIDSEAFDAILASLVRARVAKVQIVDGFAFYRLRPDVLTVPRYSPVETASV
jgi:hypothetical protein